MVGDGELDADELRTWLPKADDLIYIAEHEFGYAGVWFSGAAHPSLLCSTLYARIGEWEVAATVAEGILAIPPVDMGPYVRIEALRLLARCHGTAGNRAKHIAKRREHFKKE